MKQVIEKAHQVGDAHPSKPLIWTEYKPGKFDWRPPKKKDVTPIVNKKEDVKTNTVSTSSAASSRVKYDAPEAKIQYVEKRPYDEAPFKVPESWQIKSKSGQLKTQKRSEIRQVLTKRTDDEIIKFLNNVKGNPNFRQLVYEEAAARGIPEDKIDVSGTLQDKWNMLKSRYDLLHPKNEDEDVNEEELETYDMSLLEGMDIPGFMAKFPGGDTGWAEKNHPFVQEEFNKLVSLFDRQRYDAFLDYQKRQSPYYESPQEQLNGLNRQLFMFFTNPKSLPIFVSAGGAGIGKTTKMLQVAERSAMKKFDPSKNSPGDGDYDFVLIDKDIEDEKEFRKILSEHNGKVLVFDDKDKLLTSTSGPIISMMKSLGDGNPEMRLFKNIDGDSEQFTGKLLFITNKTMDKLNKDEDHKAIMSRAAKNEIKLTVNEILDTLKNRYKTMGNKMLFTSSPQEEQEIRQELYNTILNNREKIDPDKFTVRKFSELLELADTILLTNKQARENDDMSDLFGGQKDWKFKVIKELNKAEDNYFEKSAESDFEEMTEESKKKMKECFKKDPKGCKELFGDEIIKLINSEEVSEEEVKKAFEDTLGDMSLDEAESIIFS